MDSAPSPAPPATSAWKVWAICAALALMTLLIFGQAVRYDFIAWDDDRYVAQNPALTAGLSARGVQWAFTTNLTRFSETAEYWQPLTSLTRLADYQLYGFSAGGHHATSVLIHLATGLVLFGALLRLTGTCWCSAIVAALFLVHPMHVEPVLWLSARKDLVNGLFFVAALWVYGWYAARPSWRRYLALFGAVLAANMGKPMAVSLPLVLLLLDIWPLQRLDLAAADRARRAGRLILEKAPLLLLSVGVASLAYFVQKDIGALAGADTLPLPWRCANAAVALATYVGKAFVPQDLAFFYPHLGRGLNLWLVAACAMGALFVTGIAWRQRLTRPWLFVGWNWFLVVLAPVLGLVQIGEQALADRYSYLSFIGLFIGVVWQVAEMANVARKPWLEGPVRAIGWLAGGVIAVFSAAAFFQVQTWRDSESVFTHALDVTRENYVAHYSLGAVLLEKGRHQEAMVHLREAARIREPFLRYQLSAAEAAAQRGAYPEATMRLTRVLLLVPWNAEVRFRLGTWLMLDRQPGKALVQFAEALRYRPGWVQPRIRIAAVLFSEGQVEKADLILQEVEAQEPGNVEARELRQRIRAARDSR